MFINWNHIAEYSDHSTGFPSYQSCSSPNRATEAHGRVHGNIRQTNLPATSCRFKTKWKHFKPWPTSAGRRNSGGRVDSLLILTLPVHMLTCSWWKKCLRQQCLREHLPPTLKILKIGAHSDKNATVSHHECAPVLLCQSRRRCSLTLHKLLWPSEDLVLWKRSLWCPGASSHPPTANTQPITAQDCSQVRLYCKHV